MKKILLLLCWLLTGFSFQTQAGNILGGDLTYQCVAPGIYHVRFRMAQDCSPVPPAMFVNLQLSSPGCSAPGRTVALNRGQLNASTLIQDYCPRAAPSNCAPFNQPGSGFWVEYSGTINFSAAEQACPNWTLGVLVDTDSRSATANLVSTAPFYLEAYLRLGGVHNSSVEYSPLNIPYSKVVVNWRAQYSFNDAEIDGDSLAFFLRPALQAPASSIAYQTPYSFQYPVNSSSSSTLDATNGEFRFMPTVLMPNSPPTQGQNRYATVFQVDEYRKLNGAMQLVGSSQRNMMFEVVLPDSTINHPPGFGNFTANGQPYNPAVPLVITVGQPVTLRFEAIDQDSLDLLRVVADTTALQATGIADIKILNNFIRPVIEITFTPNNSHAQPTPYYFGMTVNDDSCPINSITTEVLAFEVRGALGTRPEPTFATNFKAYPNPFTEEVYFEFSAEAKASSIVICDLLGKQVDQIQLVRTGVNNGGIGWSQAGKFAAGTYVAKLVSGNKTVQTLKFTKLQ